MPLNDLTRRKNEHFCQFRNKQDMASHCHYVWIHLFWHLQTGDPWIDVVVWEIGSTVLVRPACTALDESNRAFVRPYPHYFQVKGYKQERNKIERQKHVNAATIAREQQALQRELIQQIQEAIVKGFHYKRTQQFYAKYNSDDRPFTVVVTTEDKGLHASEFTVVWKNRRGLSATQIHKKAVASQGKKAPKEERGKSAGKLHGEKLAKSRKNEREASRQYWQQAKEVAEKRKPAVRKKIAAQIEQGEASLSKPTKGKSKRVAAAAKRFLLSLDDGNQQQRKLAPTVKLDKLVDVVVTHRWANFDQYNNRMWEYRYAFVDPVGANSRLSRQALWGKLNRNQKVFYALLMFTGETDNGGVWQFLFNRPEFSLAALEAMNEIGVTRLARDYQNTLEEFVGKARSLSEMRKRFDDEGLSSEKQWQAFVEGYQELKSTAKIENYFFTASFKKTLHKKMADYVEGSYHLFARVKP